MKALVKARAEPGIWMQDIAEPSVGHNDVLIKIHRSAICGTDMHIYNWDAWAQKTIPVPMAVGHEYSGEIVDMGVELGIVQKSGSWFSYGGDKLGQGRDAVKQLLVDNPEMANEIEAKIREKIKEMQVA